MLQMKEEDKNPQDQIHEEETNKSGMQTEGKSKQNKHTKMILKEV